MSTTLNIVVRQRRDTSAAWQAVNPVLPAGQLGFETDTGRFKLGDGATAWNALPYAGGGLTIIETQNEADFNSTTPGPGEMVVLYE